MTQSSTALTDLQSTWHSLNDLDRGRAVNAIRLAGTRVRAIARTLNCSESLLRHLLQAIQARREDRSLARQGTISTNELVRRVRSTGIRRSGMHREAREFERKQASLEACGMICDWLAAENISKRYCIQIIDEARRVIEIATSRDTLPKNASPLDTPVTAIIQHCRPPQDTFEELGTVAWFPRWLAVWACYAFTDAPVRDTALRLALEKQSGK